MCPWSYGAWKQNKIDIVNWGTDICDLGPYMARIYICENQSPRKLKKKINRLNESRQQEEWLWSHPRFKNKSAPVPILIQQDRQTLERLRDKIDSKYSQ